MKNLILIIMFFLMSITVIFSQTGTSKLSAKDKYVYAITIKHKEEDKIASIMTGVKVEGYDGIFTALHGLLDSMGEFKKGNITATRIALLNNEWKEENKIENLVVKGVNIEKDIVLLGLRNQPLSNSKKNQFLEKKEGFSIEESPILVAGQRLKISGFPTKIPETRDITVLGEPIMKLGAMIYGLSFNNKKNKRNSQPLLDQLAVHLSDDAFKGHSGAPLILNNEKIIGVSNGGYTSNGRTVFTWGIIWPKKLQVGESIQKIESSIKGLQYSTLETIPDSEPVKIYNLFSFPKASPNWIVGGTISKSFAINLHSQNNTINWKDLSGYANFFIERKIAKWLMLGGYISNNYMQYKMLKPVLNESFLANTPEVNALNNRTLLGLQVSLSLVRGVLYQLYLGGGAGTTINATSDKFINNYRGYIGIRHYLWHQQYFSLDFKAMYLSQLGALPIRTEFGNSRYDNLNQLHLCFGINISFGSTD